MSANGFADITGRWDYADLPDNIRIGAGCWIERKASFDRFRSQRQPGLLLGDRVRVYTWTVFNIEPSGAIQVGDDAVLVGAVFMCAERIVIGKRAVISYNVTIADSDFHPKDPEARVQDAIANAPSGDRRLRPAFTSKPVIIEDDVEIGVGAIILKGVCIGAGARVQAGSVVASNIPSGATAAGNPARLGNPIAK